MRARLFLFPLVILCILCGVTVGATAAPCPVGKKILIDNGQSGYSETGNDWATWSSAGEAIGTDYRYLSKTVGGADRKGTAKWTPTLPAAGTYKVSAIFRATENRSPDADYFVFDANGKSHHYVIDQRDGATAGKSHGPVYKSLGSHYLAPGKGHVLLDGTDDDHSDEADAVEFVLVSCSTAPPPKQDAGVKPQ